MSLTSDTVQIASQRAGRGQNEVDVEAEIIVTARRPCHRRRPSDELVHHGGLYQLIKATWLMLQR